MNRCNFRLTPFLVALAACAGLLGLPALAQTDQSTAPTEPVKHNVRKFPPKAVRGEMVVLAPPGITMDGKTDQLSPGAHIRDTNNMLVLSGALVNQTLTVNYLRENMGLVHEVWILNSEEIKQKRPNSKSSFWIFNFGNSGASAGVKAP